MTVEDFVALPYSKQLTKCVLRYLNVAEEIAFVNGKPTGHFFRCRTYLMKLDRQSIKNIYFMLGEHREKVPIYMLEDKAKEYVRGKQIEDSRQVVVNAKDYELDLDKFLGD